MAWAGERGSVTAEDALTTLYVEHYRSLVRLAAFLLDDVGTSEEVVQDAYVKMLGAWKRIEDPEKAAAYLRSTVLNLARSKLRRRLVVRKHQPVPPDDAASAEHDVIAHENQREVVAALRRLPPRQREAIVLRYYADLSEAEIAAAMSCSPGTVKSHIHRGKAALAELLEVRP